MFTAGASASALTIAGLAFGLASDTFTNYYSRLLLEIEKSTVEDWSTRSGYNIAIH